MGRRLTHEEFMEKFYEKNENAENIEILGEYINNRTKIKCKCKIDEYEWEARPSDLLNNHGCPKCGIKSRVEKRSKTHEDFINELKEINNDIEVLEKYVNAITKIKVRCKVDGYEWEVRPDSLLKGSGCPKCAGNIQLTHEEFINRIKNINNDIEILGEYVNSQTKIKCKCKIDGHKWEIRPNDLLNNHGCPKCAGNIKKTTEEFINELKEINSDIEIIGEYINDRTKIKCKCKIDGYEWEVTPHNLLKGTGCPKCGIKSRVEKQIKTHEEFINELKEINSDIEVLEEYKGALTKIKCKCKIDGNEWEMTPNSLLNGQGCPKCSASKGEKRVAKYLDNKSIDYERQYKFDNCRSKKELPFDFYILNLNIAIEYDGRQHFKIIDYFGGLDGFIDTKVRDTIKTIYCKENNIKLIRIAYWDFDNIEKILEKEL